MKSIKEKKRTEKKNAIAKTDKKKGKISFLNERMKNGEGY